MGPAYIFGKQPNTSQSGTVPSGLSQPCALSRREMVFSPHDSKSCKVLVRKCMYSDHKTALISAQKAATGAWQITPKVRLQVSRQENVMICLLCCPMGESFSDAAISAICQKADLPLLKVVRKCHPSAAFYFHCHPVCQGLTPSFSDFVFLASF